MKTWLVDLPTVIVSAPSWHYRYETPHPVSYFHLKTLVLTTVYSHNTPLIPDFGKLGQENKKLRTRLCSMNFVYIHGRSWSLALPGMSLTDFGGWVLLLQNALRSTYPFVTFTPLEILRYERVMCGLTFGELFLSPF